MKHLPTIARYLLGLIFVVFGLNFWMNFLEVPRPGALTPAAAFMGAMYGSGYLTVVKVIEVLGGVLLLSGRFVNLGLILLGPIVVNIALYHGFLVKGGYPMAIALVVLSLIVLADRKDLRKVIFSAK
jgi:putative oxidoreductase